MTESQEREAQIGRIATDLLPHASHFTRLVIREARGDISRTEGGILRTLAAGSRRITELADLEGLAQPTMTVLVKRLEERGWVRRGRDADDRRVMLITLTADGARALQTLRSAYRSVLAERLAAMSGAQLAELEVATTALGQLVEELQRGGGR